MTQPTPPSSRRPDPRFARDVAKHLDRRRTGRRLFGWTALLAAIAAAAYYLTCGHGFGLGGFGTGTGDGPGEVSTLAGPRRCAIRITGAGITVAGKPMQRAEAVAACKAAPGVDILVTGDARQGDGKALEDALVAAGVTDIQFVQPMPGPGSGSGAAPSRRE
jgi:hypothetical protein